MSFRIFLLGIPFFIRVPIMSPVRVGAIHVYFSPVCDGLLSNVHIDRPYHSVIFSYHHCVVMLGIIFV